eukprot:SAG31_NODE_7391_length_1702_cov_1.137867_1_plen_362_part_10
MTQRQWLEYGPGLLLLRAVLETAVGLMQWPEDPWSNLRSAAIQADVRIAVGSFRSICKATAEWPAARMLQSLLNGQRWLESVGESTKRALGAVDDPWLQIVDSMLFGPRMQPIEPVEAGLAACAGGNRSLLRLSPGNYVLTRPLVLPGGVRLAGPPPVVLQFLRSCGPWASHWPAFQRAECGEPHKLDNMDAQALAKQVSIGFETAKHILSEWGRQRQAGEFLGVETVRLYAKQSIGVASCSVGSVLSDLQIIGSFDSSVNDGDGNSIEISETYVGLLIAGRSDLTAMRVDIVGASGAGVMIEPGADEDSQGSSTAVVASPHPLLYERDWIVSPSSRNGSAKEFQSSGDGRGCRLVDCKIHH